MPSTPAGPAKGRAYLEAILFGTTFGSFVVAYTKFSVPGAWWIGAIVAVVIGLFLTMVFIPFVRLLLLGLLGFFLAALATTALFLGRVI